MDTILSLYRTRANRAPETRSSLVPITVPESMMCSVKAVWSSCSVSVLSVQEAFISSSFFLSNQITSPPCKDVTSAGIVLDDDLAVEVPALNADLYICIRA